MRTGRRGTTSRASTSTGSSSPSAGEPPQALRRRILLERAAYRMITTKAPLIDIAVEAGYSSHEAFTRAFSKAYDVPPREWRKKPGHIQIGEPLAVHFVPPAQHPAAVPRRGEGAGPRGEDGGAPRLADRRDGPRRGTADARAARRDGAGRGRRRRADAALAAQPAGRPDGHVERRDGDPRLRLERRGARVGELDAPAARRRGSALPRPRARGLRAGPARGHLRRRDLRARRRCSPTAG